MLWLFSVAHTITISTATTNERTDWTCCLRRCFQAWSRWPCALLRSVSLAIICRASSRLDMTGERRSTRLVESIRMTAAAAAAAASGGSRIGLWRRQKKKDKWNDTAPKWEKPTRIIHTQLNLLCCGRAPEPGPEICLCSFSVYCCCCCGASIHIDKTSIFVKKCVCCLVWCCPCVYIMGGGKGIWIALLGLNQNSKVIPLFLSFFSFYPFQGEGSSTRSGCEKSWFPKAAVAKDSRQELMHTINSSLSLSLWLWLFLFSWFFMTLLSLNYSPGRVCATEAPTRRPGRYQTWLESSSAGPCSLCVYRRCLLCVHFNDGEIMVIIYRPDLSLLLRYTRIAAVLFPCFGLREPSSRPSLRIRYSYENSWRAFFLVIITQCGAARNVSSLFFLFSPGCVWWLPVKTKGVPYHQKWKTSKT